MEGEEEDEEEEREEEQFYSTYEQVEGLKAEVAALRADVASLRETLQFVHNRLLAPGGPFSSHVRVPLLAIQLPSFTLPHSTS